jgi:hypothetical protein
VAERLHRYAGLVLVDKAAVTFWRSWLVPTQFGLSSLAMSIAAVMARIATTRTSSPGTTKARRVGTVALRWPGVPRSLLALATRRASSFAMREACP